jgi:hypothetical protein
LADLDAARDDDAVDRRGDDGAVEIHARLYDRRRRLGLLQRRLGLAERRFEQSAIDRTSCRPSGVPYLTVSTMECASRRRT